MTKEQYGQRRKQILIKRDYQLYQGAIWVLGSIIVLNMAIILLTLVMKWDIMGNNPFRNGLILAGVEFLIAALAYYLAIKNSLKIAGPVYALERELKRIQTGDLTQKLSFRAKDQFLGSAEIYNQTREGICERIKTMQALVTRLREIPIDNEQARALIDDLHSEIFFFKTHEDEEKS